MSKKHGVVKRIVEGDPEAAGRMIGGTAPIEKAADELYEETHPVQPPLPGMPDDVEPPQEDQ